MNNELLKKLNLSLKLILGERKESTNDYGDWENRALKELDKIVDSNHEIRPEKIERFIGDGIFVTEQPTATIKGINLNNKLFYLFIKFLTFTVGAKKSGVKEAKLTYNELKNQDMLALLEKYPMSDTGKPFKISYKGCLFTNRYLRHIYFVSVFNKYLKERLPHDPIILDIGSSYGLFQRFIKKEIPSSHNILVEIPGQLILAHYYLEKEFPDAKIASLVDINNELIIDEKFVRQYDFILVPTTMYHKLVIKKVDVVTNFISLSEMSKEWFDVYVNSIPFKAAKYFYTANRYDSFPTYSNGLTIFDFPLSEYNKIVFKTLPILKSYYLPFVFFLTKKMRFTSEVFQFIGEKKKVRL